MLIAVSQGIAARYGEQVRAVARGIELVSPEGGAWPERAAAAEVAYFSDDFWAEEENRRGMVGLFTLPAVRWFHSFSAGVDHPAFRALIERGVLLTNSAGATSEPIAQYVLGMMLRVAKRFDAWAEAQRNRRWLPLEAEELTGKTVGVVGTGNIGGEVARLAKAFGMRVIGCRRSGRRPRYVDELVPPERLLDLLRQSDFVVLAVPLSAGTDRLIGQAELAAMQPHAWLINISRGRVVDEAAVVRALRDGSIGGACLDVFEEEPLLPDSELWSLPNAIVTPHNSGRSPLNTQRATAIFLDNLHRYVAGRTLRNRIRESDLGPA